MVSLCERVQKEPIEPTQCAAYVVDENQMSCVPDTHGKQYGLISWNEMKLIKIYHELKIKFNLSF